MSNINEVYSERNRLAIAFCKSAIAAGWIAGVRFDEDHKEWEDGWRWVVFIKLPNGKQVSWHISPNEVELIKDLPTFPEKWDGTFLGREEDWTNEIKFEQTKTKTKLVAFNRINDDTISIKLQSMNAIFPFDITIGDIYTLSK